MKLDEVLEVEPLSTALRCTLRLAQEQGASDLVKWLQLEIGGYYATNSHSIVIVPAYRAVTGAQLNIYGQHIKIQPGSPFSKEIRLHEGIDALEAMRNSHQTIVHQIPTTIGLIAQEGEAATFHFEPAEIIEVLSQIRSELLRRAAVLAELSP